MIGNMTRRFAAAVIVTGMLGTGSLMAADVDLSSPKAAVTTLAKAMQENDVDAAKAAISGDEQEMKSIEAMMDVLGSMQRMEKAAKAKFGEDVVEETAGGLAEVVEQTDKAEVEIDGDNAVVTVPQAVAEGQDPSMAPPPQKLQLAKEGDNWKVDAAALMQGQIPTDEQLTAVRAVAKAANSIADEIEADKYETYEDAKAAYQQKMFAAMMEAMPQQPAPE